MLIKLIKSELICMRQTRKLIERGKVRRYLAGSVANVDPTLIVLLVWLLIGIGVELRRSLLLADVTAAKWLLKIKCQVRNIFANLLVVEQVVVPQQFDLHCSILDFQDHLTAIGVVH